MIPRLPFKPEFVGAVKSGMKCHTARWKRVPGLYEGATAAATTSMNGKPAFLTPVASAFATVRIKRVEDMPFADFTEDHAALCQVSRDWYLRERPLAKDTDRIVLYEFEILEVRNP